MRTVVRGLGELLVTAGLVILLFAGYELYGTGVAAGRDQSELLSQLRTDWGGSAPAAPDPPSTDPPSTGVAPARTGEALALLHIPRFGADWKPRVIVEGTSPADLRRGPGHYPESALPGQVGNFAVAGHRATYGNGFRRLPELRVGDPVVIETKLMWITYRVTTVRVVAPSQRDVVAPVPGKAGVTPSQRYLTLTTCDPWYSAERRLIVHALFGEATAKSAGRPAALAG